MNAEEFYPIRIGAMISHGFIDDAVRDRLNLKGASELWGGQDIDIHPAWYLWLSISPGAYRLRLEETESIGGDAGPLLRGLFSIKYYPSPLEPVFGHYSKQEQALIESDLFDHTNTPSFDALERIPENLFSVGSVEFLHDVDCGQSYLGYASIKELRFRRGDEGAAGTEPGADGSLGISARTRQLPAWSLGYPLFEALVGMYAFQARRMPKRIILSEQPGFEFVETSADSYACHDTANSVFKSLLVAFFPEHVGPTSQAEQRVCSELLSEPWTPVLDYELGQMVAAGFHHPGRCHREHALQQVVAPSQGDTCESRRETCPNHDLASRSSTRGGGRRHQLAARAVEVGDASWDIPLAFNEEWWTLAHAEHSAHTMPCGCK